MNTSENIKRGGINFSSFSLPSSECTFQFCNRGIIRPLDEFELVFRIHTQDYKRANNQKKKKANEHD